MNRAYYSKEMELKVEMMNKTIGAFKEMSKAMNEKGELKAWKYANKMYDISNEKGLKKLFKAMTKKNLYWLYYEEEQKPSELINHFEVVESYEKRISVYIFKNEKGIIDKIKRHMDWEATPNHYDYSPTGMFFKDEARFYEFPDRVIVTQSIVLDC